MTLIVCTIENLFQILINNYKTTLELSKDKIKVQNCYQDIQIKYNNNTWILHFNSLSLDFTSKTLLPNKLKKIIYKNIKLIENKEDKTVKEFRGFFFFLKSYYNLYYQEIKFIKRESPDFMIFFDDKEIALEVTKSTTPHFAQFEKIINSSDCRTPEGYRKYQSEHHPNTKGSYSFESYGNTTVSSSSIGLVSPRSFVKLIYKAIEKKSKKFNNYKINTDYNYILILHDDFGFDDDIDYVKVANFIKNSSIVKGSRVTNIVIKNYDKLVEYSKTGEHIETYRI